MFLFLDIKIKLIKMRKLTGLEKSTFILLFSILFIYALREAKHFLYPIALAVLFSYLLFPLTNFLEKKIKLPRALAILLSIFFSFFVIYMAISFYSAQISNMISDFPAIKKQTVENLKSLQYQIENKFQISIEEQERWVQEQITKLLESTGNILKIVSTKAIGTLEAILLIPIFVFFMLFYRERWRNFILMLADKPNRKLTDELMSQISKVTTKYIVGVIIDVSILATLHSIFLTIFGLKYSIVIAIMTAMISFIPYFGTPISTIIPLTFSLILSSNPYTPILIILYFWFITFIDHNIFIPTIIGGNVHLNPLITILSVIAGAMIWGIPGMIIIIPIIGMIKIICDNVEGLEPYGYVLGIDTQPKALNKLKDIFAKLKEKEENENSQN